MAKTKALLEEEAKVCWHSRIIEKKVDETKKKFVASKLLIVWSQERAAAEASLALANSELVTVRDRFGKDAAALREQESKQVQCV